MEVRERVPSQYQMIRSLRIENFRCFASVHLDDIRRFTIVTGENGSGKTALLESLFVSAGGSPEIYLRAGAWRGNELIIPSAPSSAISVFEDFFYKFNVETGLKISFEDDRKGTREVHIVADMEEVVNIPYDSKSSESSILSPGLKFSWKTPQGDFESQIEVTSKGIRIPKSVNPYKMSLINQHTSISSRENVERFSNLSTKNQEKTVIDAIRTLFPQVEDLSIQVKGNSPALFVKVSGIDHKMPLGLVSAGINKFLSILLSITANPSGVVLIDEVENGLYYKLLVPMWKMLMKHCRDNQCQLIVTTHSKEFLDSMAPLIAGNENDFSLLRTEWENGEATISSFSGKEFAAALESGFEVR